MLNSYFNDPKTTMTMEPSSEDKEFIRAQEARIAMRARNQKIKASEVRSCTDLGTATQHVHRVGVASHSTPSLKIPNQQNQKQHRKKYPKLNTK